MKWIDINCFLGAASFPLTVTFTDEHILLDELDELGIAEAWYTCFDGFIPGSPSPCSSRLMKVPFLSLHSFLSSETLPEIPDGTRVLRCRIDLGAMPENWSIEPVLNLCRNQHWILFADYRPAIGFSHTAATADGLRKLPEALVHFPGQPVILSSLKFSGLYHEVAALLKACPDVYLDLSSFQFFRALEYLKQQGVLKQVLFGSSMPYFDAGQFIVEVRCSDLTQEEKDAVAFKNTERLLEW